MFRNLPTLFRNRQAKKWFQWFHLVEWWYNSTYHTSAKMTPFQALYGYETPKWKDLVTNYERVASVSDHLEENTARNRMKQQADRHRT